MHIDRNGITLFPAEIAALLRFAEKSEDSPYSVVHLRSEDDWVWAYSTDAKRALQARGPCEDPDAPDGEWTVYRRFLDDARKLCTSEDHVLLEVRGASLHRAVVMKTETMEEITSVEWPRDAASNQMTFPLDTLRQLIKLPTTERPVRCVSVPASQLSDLAAVGKAAHDRLDLYPGRSRMDPLTFRIDDITEWTGLIQPVRDREKFVSESDDVQEDDEAPALFETDDKVVPIKNKKRKNKNTELPFDGES